MLVLKALLGEEGIEVVDSESNRTNKEKAERTHMRINRKADMLFSRSSLSLP